MREHLPALFICALFFTHAKCQSRSFEWGIPSVGTNFTLTECTEYSIQLDLTPQPNGPPPQSPFYMFASPPSGVASVVGIGDNPSNLKWTTSYAAGTQLLLQVLDANGNTGGVDTNIYTISPGSATCQHVAPESPINVQAHRTNISTCDTLVLDIVGGSPPYSVSIVPLNGVTVFNSTLGAPHNQLSWIDRAVPADSTLLLAAAHDGSGQWARSSPFISIVGGGNDVSCIGKEDTEGFADSSTGTPDSSTSTPDSSTSTPNSSTGTPDSSTGAPRSPSPPLTTKAIIGIVIGILVTLIIIGCVLCQCLRAKKIRNSRKPHPEHGISQHNIYALSMAPYNPTSTPSFPSATPNKESTFTSSFDHNEPYLPASPGRVPFRGEFTAPSQLPILTSNHPYDGIELADINSPVPVATPAVVTDGTAKPRKKKKMAPVAMDEGGSVKKEKKKAARVAAEEGSMSSPESAAAKKKKKKPSTSIVDEGGSAIEKPAKKKKKSSSTPVTSSPSQYQA